MTSQEIQKTLETLLDASIGNIAGAKLEPAFPLWEIAYQLAKQVEQQEELIQLMRIQITRNTGLAGPQPGKMYEHTLPVRGGTEEASFGLADPQPVKRDADSEPGEGMSDHEKLIRDGFCFDSDRDCEAAKYLLGVIDAIRCDRNRLRKHFQREQSADPATEAPTQTQNEQLAAADHEPESAASAEAKPEHPSDCECPTCRFHRPL